MSGKETRSTVSIAVKEMNGLLRRAVGLSHN